MEKALKHPGRLAAGIVSALLKLLVIFVIAYPFIWMVFTSFKPYAETTVYPPTLFPRQWTTEGYTKALQMVDVWGFLKNSLVVSLSVLVLQYLIIIPAAYAFARCRFRGKGFFFGIVLLGFMIPQQVTFVPVYLMFSKAGLLQSFLPQILPFIANAFGIFLLRQYFMQVPDELIEAARLDNAGELKIIYQLMLPLSKAALSTSVLFSFVNHWNDYFWPMVVTSVEQIRPLTVGIARLKDEESITEWNVIFAGNMFLVLPILVVYMFCSKYIIRAFAYNGVK